jgi:hypothetical protein
MLDEGATCSGACLTIGKGNLSMWFVLRNSTEKPNVISFLDKPKQTKQLL